MMHLISPTTSSNQPDFKTRARDERLIPRERGDVIVHEEVDDGGLHELLVEAYAHICADTHEGVCLTMDDHTSCQMARTTLVSFFEGDDILYSVDTRVDGSWVISCLETGSMIIICFTESAVVFAA
ncbi:MAG: hypothetical protein JRH20_05435 [Deltaproteobacteria bacterium]|nr:hypothetical protein [Deltaproteobacteria bacterium]